MKNIFIISSSFFLISLLNLPGNLFSQSVGIGTITPNTSSRLDITSTSSKEVTIPHENVSKFRSFNQLI